MTLEIEPIQESKVLLCKKGYGKTVILFWSVKRAKIFFLQKYADAYKFSMSKFKQEIR